MESGIVTRYEILDHPTEHRQAVTAAAHPLNLVTADREVHAADTERRLRQQGIRRVAIPASGNVSAERRALERTPAFRRGSRFRADTCGRIASLRWDSGWRRYRSHGMDGMERWLGLGVLASHLRQIVRMSRREAQQNGGGARDGKTKLSRNDE
ncbi:MAG TPA: hypothetical protein VGF67_13110 [Ktedonobacteraceae bacterium]|jgi:IS5 family transposase